MNPKPSLTMTGACHSLLKTVRLLDAELRFPMIFTWLNLLGSS